ncbi:hypothetical protein FAK_30920 [Desulfoferula mesophila]|uniref:Uncharacterized protein n=2 Tax=Desulfoferula mesophila TaxID=3058419 RepID=A0AAU9EZN1_9BACT|nr:hypothetical protein FAK_30920 [Desulfoferula mesophilus]
MAANVGQRNLNFWLRQLAHLRLGKQAGGYHITLLEPRRNKKRGAPTNTVETPLTRRMIMRAIRLNESYSFSSGAVNPKMVDRLDDEQTPSKKEKK